MSHLRPQSASFFAVSKLWDKPERELRSPVLDVSEPEPVKPGLVLIADGDLGSRRALEDLVAAEHATASIIHAANGAEALAALKHHEVELALVDRCLRGLDGAKFRPLSHAGAAFRPPRAAMGPSGAGDRCLRRAAQADAFAADRQPDGCVFPNVPAHERARGGAVAQDPRARGRDAAKGACFGSISISATQRKTP